MSWRTIQLGTSLCDQDQLIIDLVGARSVQIHGNARGFDQFCKIDPHSDFCLIFVNQPLWLSEIKNQLIEYLSPGIKYVYIGINRYQIKGNDTSYRILNPALTPGNEVLQWLTDFLKELKFHTIQQGCFEKDRGRYFNFVQPLTWVYAEYETDRH